LVFKTIETKKISKCFIKKKYQNVLEREEISEKLRDIILFHSYNNNILTTYINKILEENKLENVVKESI